MTEQVPTVYRDRDFYAFVSARFLVTAAMQAIEDALVLAATHKRYVPVSERPKPYVRKGVEV